MRERKIASLFFSPAFFCPNFHTGLSARSPRRSAPPSLTEGGALVSSNGNLTLNSVPFPTSLLASILPPCESTIHLTIDRPSPKPAAVRSAVLAERRKNLSKMWGRSSGGMPRPVSATVLGLKYEGEELERLIEHTAKLFLNGIANKAEPHS